MANYNITTTYVIGVPAFPINPYLQFHQNDADLRTELNTAIELANRVQSLSHGYIFSEEASTAEVVFSELLNAPFRATSYPIRNKIIINKESFSKLSGDLYAQVFSIIFERFNISCKKEYLEIVLEAKHSDIDKETFVERIEKLEHTNYIAAREVLIMGVQRGVLRSSIHNSSKIFADFTTHYKYQQLMKHSQFIANQYNRITGRRKPSYQGTFPLARKHLTQEQKNLIIAIFVTKLNMSREVDNGPSKLSIGCCIVFSDLLKRSATIQDSLQIRAIKTLIRPRSIKILAKFHPIQIETIHQLFTENELADLRTVAIKRLFLNGDSAFSKNFIDPKKTLRTFQQNNI